VIHLYSVFTKRSAAVKALSGFEFVEEDLSVD
jgi:hypothetical protein